MIYYSIETLIGRKESFTVFHKSLNQYFETDIEITEVKISEIYPSIKIKPSTLDCLMVHFKVGITAKTKGFTTEFVSIEFNEFTHVHTDDIHDLISTLENTLVDFNKIMHSIALNTNE